MSQVHLDIEALRHLAEMSIKAGTQDKFIAIALEWAEHADREIKRLLDANPTGESRP